MTEHRQWIRKLTRLVRPGQPAPARTYDGTGIDERIDHARYWRDDTDRREQKANQLRQAIAPFQDRLDQLRTRAETARDSLTASTYDSVWREMGEELGFVIDDLERGRTSEHDLTDLFGEWNAKAYAHLRHHPDAAAIFEPPADRVAEDTPTGVLATEPTTKQPRDADLGGEAGQFLPWAAPADPATGETAAPLQVMQQIGDLLGRAEYAEMNAERVEDADQPGQAEQLRQQAAQLHREAEKLAREAGLSNPYDDDEEATELDADLEATRGRDRQLYDAEVAHRVDGLAEEVDAAGDIEDATKLRDIAARTWHTPSDWDGESVTVAERWQIDAGTQAEDELKATDREVFSGRARDAEAADGDTDETESEVSTATAEQTAEPGELYRHDERPIEDIDWDQYDDRDAVDDLDEVVESAPVASAEDTTTDQQVDADDLHGQIDSIACTAAIRRAEVTVARVREQADTAVAESERDAELDRWHADDTAASAKAEQAIDTQAADLGSPLADA